MMKLTKKADYGLIALKHLAMYGNVGSVSAKDIADCYGIPQALLAKILQKLARNGYLQSQHGTRGGYLLARDPGQITALEVIRLIDGPVLLTSCETPRGACDHTEKCNVREPLRKVHDTLLGLLGALTISELSREDAAGACPTCGPPAACSTGLHVL